MSSILNRRLRSGERGVAKAGGAAFIRLDKGNPGRIVRRAVNDGVGQGGIDDGAVHRRLRVGVQQRFQRAHLAQVFAGQDNGVRALVMAAQFGQEIARSIVASQVAVAQPGIDDDGFVARAQDGAAVRRVVVARRGKGGDAGAGEGEGEPQGGLPQ